MKTSFACGFALLLAGCGVSTLESASTTMPGGGGGGASPSGHLCEDVLGSGDSCPTYYYDEPLLSFVAGSELRFRGTVTALHATTAGLEDFIDETRSIVVRVDAMIDGEEDVLSLTGKAVTVVTLSVPMMPVGYQGYFFATTGLIGESVGTIEVAHIDLDVYPTLESDVPRIVVELAEKKLYQHILAQGTVIVGTVTGLGTLPDTGAASEHDPVWAEAIITADCTLHGATPAVADVAFATSDEAGGPQLSSGQRGVFMLRSILTHGEHGLPERIGYFIGGAADVLPVEERAHIANLVVCAPGG